MKRIFDGLESIGNEVANHSNGSHPETPEEIRDSSERRVSPAQGPVAANRGESRISLMPPPVLEMDPAAREEIIRLIHTVFLRPGGSRVVAFSGVQPGVGCSWLLVRTAALLAAADSGSVCVVDANLRSPSLHTYLNARNRYGLSDVLVDSQPVRESVFQISRHFHLLSSGSMPLRAASLLASSAFRSCVDELRAAFDFVLFDTPPLATTSDGLLVAGTVDGLAMVVEANSTNRDTALKAARAAMAANTRILGAVLNKRTYPIPKAIYKKLRYA